MVKLKDILTPAFRKPVGMSRKLVERCLSTDSRFCREVVASGMLKEEQMRRAAARYRLGRSRSGETVFWMIDKNGNMRDGQVGDTWVSLLMKANGRLSVGWQSKPCLFGEQLIKPPSTFPCLGDVSKATIDREDSGESIPVAVVESARSAVVLSELFPKYVWMATMLPAFLNEGLFLPLRGHKVVCFPATDVSGDNYLLWLETARQAHARYGLDITVRDFLERRASPEQKEDKIDLLKYIFRVKKSPTF